MRCCENRQRGGFLLFTRGRGISTRYCTVHLQSQSNCGTLCGGGLQRQLRMLSAANEKRLNAKVCVVVVERGKGKTVSMP